MDDRLETNATRMARSACAAAACALALCAAPVRAAPPVGTVIANHATATAQLPSGTQNATSNTVLFAVGSTTAPPPPLPGQHVQLEISAGQIVDPGATVFFPHVLTNVGTGADTYTLSIADNLANQFHFSSVALFADTDADGRPDSATPISAPVALPPGGTFHFVARIVVPASAAGRQVDSATVSARASGGETVANTDSIQIRAYGTPDCGIVMKTFSRLGGTSPGGPVTVTLAYDPCDQARSMVTLLDVLPAGLAYVPGSGRWSGTAGVVLTDADAADLQGTAPAQVAYDFGVTQAGTVAATVHGIPANTTGYIQFQVNVAPGLDVGTVLTNTATYVFYDNNGNYEGMRYTNPATYGITGRAGLTLTGAHLGTVQPGTAASFTNVLTNTGTVPDTYEITVGASTFPPGTTFELFKADGVTPLADTDHDSTPDTGTVAPGATYTIVLKAQIPATAIPGAYKVTKTARSGAAPAVSASADDAVDTIASKCEIDIDKTNQALEGYGEHVTYLHTVTNHGNCMETVQATADYLVDSRAAAGWTSSAYVDNDVAGNGSLPGVVDATDIPIVRSWTTTLGPGKSLHLLVDVRAPNAPSAGAQAAKKLVDTDVTTLSLSSTSNPTLVAKDTTMLDDAASAPQPSDVVQNFTDSSYGSPTPWGVVGGNLWLRADAPSCNAAPGSVEQHTIVITGPNGEREEVTAVETGPNTGIFEAPALPVRSPPVVAGDGTLQGDPNTTFQVEVLGCSRSITNVVTLMAAQSVVFDSASGAAVPGTVVTLVNASGSQCGTTAATTVGANPVTTDAQGRFIIAPASSGSYCLAVQAPNGYHFASKVPWPQLPVGHNLVVTGPTSGGSYGNPFTQAGGQPVVVDLPVDGVAQSGLFVQKQASKASAELGDFVDYSVQVRNGTGNVLDHSDVILTDDLPAGFGYVKGTARRDGQVLADPQGGAGPHLVFTLGHLTRDQQVTITYRVRLGPGSMQGDGTNRAQASYRANGTTTLSNTAAARVQVTGGVFSDQGFILGKVYLDCNSNGMQDTGDLGVPGVRLLIEDGTYVISDGRGQFSFYGLDNRTHVLKVDRTSLPVGARLEAISQRNLGDGGSRVVDLKAGEMARGDFAIAGCDAGILAEVKSRAAKMVQGDELSVLAGTQLTTIPVQITDVKALPASGVVVAIPTAVLPNAPVSGAAAPVAPTSVSNVFPTPPANVPADRPSPALRIVLPQDASATPPAAEPQPLEAIVPSLDSKLGFIGLTDGQVMPYAQATVRVKGTAGTSFKLVVNGKPVDESRVGKRSTLADKQVQAWEYIGVELKPGENLLELSQVDSFGIARGKVELRVVAPGELARIVIELPAGSAVADGKTPARVIVKLTDAKGVPVTGRIPVTLDATLGKWLATDLEPQQPGLQVMVEGGRGEFQILPPGAPGESRIVAKTGTFETKARLDFLPELRNLVAAGVIEGVVNLRNMGAKALTPVRESDGFEQELNQISRDWGQGKTQAGVRAAFYLKGKIKGDYLLTAAYDSDKDTQERLFRDIQPDQYYPVYGDSAQRGYDAQSTSKLYVRVDHNRSYLLWGDFTTASTSEVRKLTSYSRSLTGVREHFENSRVSANVFASRDTTRQVIQEFPANGTSGPFQLSTQGSLVNSEKVEIVTRDRNQTALIISTVDQTRFVDYEMDTLAGRILFKAPVPSVDQNLNPISVRVTYEVDQGGAEFWVAGAEAQVKVTDRIEVGGVYVKDKNPLAPFTLTGVDTVVKVAEGTYVMGEVGHTEGTTLDDVSEKGNAERIEIKHDSANMKGDAYFARTDKGFDNPGAWLTQGRSEAGGRLDYKLSPRATIKADGLRTEDATTGAVTEGVALALQYQLSDKLTFEVALRHSEQKGQAAVPGADGSTPTEPGPDTVDTVRARLTGAVPGVKGATMYGEAEVDVRDPERKVLAAGGEYELPNKSRIYARHEFISSIVGPYDLNQNQQQNTSAIGIDTEYMHDGRVFSEYRIRDAMSGGDAEAALGLRNLWTLSPGLKLGTTFERVHAFTGTGTDENTAVTFGLEYTGSEWWKGSTRLEASRGPSQESLLSTMGAAVRLGHDWTALARNSYNVTRNRGEASGEHTIERMQAGFAWRDSTTNRWNALGRVEHRLESDTTSPGVELKTSTDLLSLHADWQPIRPFLVTARYAAKWESDSSNGLLTHYHAQVLGLRTTWEFAPRWDVGFVTSVLVGESASSRQYGLGVEVGYLVATNLWVSGGYNLSGYRDSDMAGADYTARGPFVRVRYKFDETTLEGALPSDKPAAPKSTEAKP